MSLTLYYHPLSSFCHKVLIALYESGVDFEKRLINLGDAADRAELAAIWPIIKFPVIRDHARDKNLAETTLIIEYLDHYFPGAHPLIPKEWDAALDVRLWDRIFDNYVQLPMQEITANQMRGAKGDMSSARSKLTTTYKMIDQHMASKTWATGREFSMADCAAAPALFYGGTVQAFPGECSHLRDYFERLMQRPSVQRVIEEAKPYFSMFPFADAIPKRFR